MAEQSVPEETNDKNGTPWTDDDLSFLYHARQDGIPYVIIAAELHRTLRACERKYQTTDWAKEKCSNAPTESMKDHLKSAEHERLTKGQDRKLQAYKIRAEIIGDRMARAIKALPPVKSPSSSRSKKKGDSEHVGLILSDLHIGHHHSLEETGGISEYNHDIFLKRVKNLKIATKEIYDLHSRLYDLPELHVFCLGDIVAGMNQSGNWSNTFINIPILDQMIEGFAAISDMLNYWLATFKRINFYGVRGNHGRAAPLGYEKDYVNWDYLCYLFLKNHFDKNSRIRFKCPPTWWLMEEIKSHNFLLAHGDDVKGGGASVLNGIANFEQKMSGIIQKIPDYTLIGHFHTCAELSTNNGRVIVNGSFVGSDVYSIKNIHSAMKPEQKIFGIHERQGMTWSYNINLDSKRGQ